MYLLFEFIVNRKRFKYGLTDLINFINICGVCRSKSNRKKLLAEDKVSFASKALKKSNTFSRASDKLGKDLDIV